MHLIVCVCQYDRETERVKERERDREREGESKREWKGEDRRRKGGILKIITFKRMPLIITQCYHLGLNIANKIKYIHILFFFCYKITEI